MTYKVTSEQLYKSVIAEIDNPDITGHEQEVDVIANMVGNHPELLSIFLEVMDPVAMVCGMMSVMYSATLRALEAQELERLVVQ